MNKPITSKGFIRVIIFMILAVVFLGTISTTLTAYAIKNDKTFYLIVGLIGFMITVFYTIIGIFNVINFYKGE